MPFVKYLKKNFNIHRNLYIHQNLLLSCIIIRPYIDVTDVATNETKEAYWKVKVVM